MKRLRVAALAALLGMAAATGQAEGPGWTQPLSVTRLVVTANGGVNVRVSPGLVNCVSQSGYGASYASIYPTHPGINRMKADLLVAYLSDKKVSLWFSDVNCTVGELVLGGTYND